MSSRNVTRASAVVILKPASGRTIDGYTQITSQNIHEFQPSAETVKRAQTFFSSSGFEVGPATGISVSITGRVAKFEDLFHVRVEVEEGVARVVRPDGSRTYDLPTDALLSSVREFVSAAGFEQPTDFGPGDFH